MKTPRDILFARHQAAAPKLDAIRREIVAGLNRQDTKAQSWSASLMRWSLGGSKLLWQELILPCRRIWTGLAAVWILIFAVNLAQRDHSPAGKITAAPAMMSFREQQRWMNEIFADRVPTAEADRPRNAAPKPRTEAAETAVV